LSSPCGGSVGSGGLHELAMGASAFPSRTSKRAGRRANLRGHLRAACFHAPSERARLRPHSRRTRWRYPAADSAPSPTAPSCARHCGGRGGGGGPEEQKTATKLLARGGTQAWRRRRGSRVLEPNSPLCPI
jgi:hypothetical protein